MIRKKKLSDDGGGSRLVADLQQHPKRGESNLPASIFDLFVKKNRRKRGKQQQVPGGEESLEIVPAPQVEKRDSPRHDYAIVEQSKQSDIQDLDRSSSLWFVQISVAVILGLLALFTKWLVIGATIAALSLSFVEFVVGCDTFKPSDGKTVTLAGSDSLIKFSRSLESGSEHQLDSRKSNSRKSEPESEEIEDEMFTVASSKGEEVSDWAYLPEHLLQTMLNQLGLVSDYVRFAAVCKPWLSAAQFHRKKWLKSSPKQLPVLLIHNNTTMKHTLHSVVGKNLVLTKDNLPVPSYSNLRCFGSSQGWLIVLQNETFDLILINPFTRATIHLPPITEISSEEPNLTTYFRSWLMYYPTKTMFVLSEDPSLHPDTYQVLALYSLQLICLLRPGSDTWVHIQQPFSTFSNLGLESYVYDALYYQGKFYITGWNWNRLFLTVETTESPSPRMILRKLSFGQEQEPRLDLPPRWHTHKKYLVESCKGYLLYIERSYVNGRNVDNEVLSGFRVYKVDISGVDSPLVQCTQLQSLDGESLFLGFNQSISVLASEFPNCQPDCIYYAYNFTYHACHFGTRIGVYDFGSQHDKPDYTEIWGPSFRNVPPPLWIIPRCSFVDED